MSDLIPIDPKAAAAIKRAQSCINGELPNADFSVVGIAVSDLRLILADNERLRAAHREQWAVIKSVAAGMRTPDPMIYCADFLARAALERKPT